MEPDRERMLFSTPLGPCLLESQGGFLVRCHVHPLDDEPCETSDSLLLEAHRQLIAYFKGQLTQFDLPMKPKGTPFQVDVWNLVAQIPMGQTRTYSELARALGRPDAARAVGSAVGKNPLWILIPCHRVVGAQGSLVGYAGGVPMKKWLLEHERATQRPDLFGAKDPSSSDLLVG